MLFHLRSMLLPTPVPERRQFTLRFSLFRRQLEYSANVVSKNLLPNIGREIQSAVEIQLRDLLIGSQKVRTEQHPIGSANEKLASEIGISGDRVVGTERGKVAVQIGELVHEAIKRATWLNLALLVSTERNVRPAGNGIPKSRSVPDKNCLRKHLQHRLQSGQPWDVNVAPRIQVNQNGQFG